MLLQSPHRVEKRCPWLWSLTAAASLLALAVLVSGIGLRAEAAPADEKKDVLIPVKDVEIKVIVPGVNTKDIIVVATPPAEEQKDKEKRKDAQKPFEIPEIKLPDIERLLKDLPANLDPEELKQIQKQMQELQEQMKRTMERVRKQVEGAQGDARKAAEGAREAAQKALRQAIELRGQQPRIANLTTTSPSRLGVRVEKPSAALAEQLDLPKDTGLLIEEVTANSAAAKAGLKPNDILLELNGKAVASDATALAKLVEEIKANTPVDALVLRKGKKETVKGITLAEAPRGRLLRLQAPNVPAVPALPARIQVRPLGGGRNVSTTITRTNDDFTARHQEGQVVISVTGTVAGGKAKPASIEVQDGDTKKYDSVDKVPEQHRDKVKNLLEAIEKGGVKIDLKAPAFPQPNRPAGKVIRPAVEAVEEGALRDVIIELEKVLEKPKK